MKLLKLFLQKISNLAYFQVVGLNFAGDSSELHLWSNTSRFSKMIDLDKDSSLKFHQKRKIRRKTENLYTEKKIKAKREMADLTVRIAKQAKVYAMHLDDENMKQIFSISSSQMLKLSDKQLVNQTIEILEGVKPIIPSLQLYGISAEDLEVLSASICEFSKTN